MSTTPGMPEAQGLYDPAHEHDACGVGFVVDIKGRKSHAIVSQALTVLKNLLHRGACGCEVEHGGRGGHHSSRCPTRSWPASAAGSASRFPPSATTGSASSSCRAIPPRRPPAGASSSRSSARRARPCSAGATCPPTTPRLARAPAPAEPVMVQVVIGRGAAVPDRSAFERKLYVIRKRTEHTVRGSDLSERKYFYIPSLSANTLIYKGMLSADQIETMFPDVMDPLVESALALVHQRFSTNTFPSWPLAHPYRYIAHNGEINTLRGNINWMRAREALCRSRLLGEDLKRILPIVVEGGSDSAVFDNVLEFLVMAGRPLPLAVLDDDSRGVERARVHGGGAAGVLRVPRLPHGALGRARVHRVHRRHRDRRRARPERPAPLALLRHQGRHGRDGLRGGRPRHPGRARPAQGAPASRDASSSSTPRRAASSTTRS